MKINFTALSLKCDLLSAEKVPQLKGTSIHRKKNNRRSETEGKRERKKERDEREYEKESERKRVRELLESFVGLSVLVATVPFQTSFYVSHLHTFPILHFNL